MAGQTETDRTRAPSCFRRSLWWITCSAGIGTPRLLTDVVGCHPSGTSSMDTQGYASQANRTTDGRLSAAAYRPILGEQPMTLQELGTLEYELFDAHMESIEPERPHLRYSSGREIKRRRARFIERMFGLSCRSIKRRLRLLVRHATMQMPPSRETRSEASNRGPAAR